MLAVSGKGIICKDPELRFTPSGKAVCNATLVNNDEYNGNKTAHFTNLVLFGERAEDFAKEITKGCLIEIHEGILKHPTHEYQGKNYYKTEVTVLEWEFIQKFEKKEDKPPQKKKQYSNSKKK